MLRTKCDKWNVSVSIDVSHKLIVHKRSWACCAISLKYSGERDCKKLKYTIKYLYGINSVQCSMKLFVGTVTTNYCE